MICINLLPWRESGFKRQRRVFFIQLTVAFCMPITICIAIWLYHDQVLKSRLLQVDKIQLDNQRLLAEIEDFEASQAAYYSKQHQIELINRLLDQRHRIPELLLFLQRQTLQFDTNYLLLNQRVLKITATGTSPNSALSLLHSLRDKSDFCQVRFAPLNQQQLSGPVEFELQAQLCDEQAD